jgi:subtilisin family serine protease
MGRLTSLIEQAMFQAPITPIVVETNNAERLKEQIFPLLPATLGSNVRNFFPRLPISTDKMPSIKEIPTFHMLGFVASKLIIEELAQNPLVNKIYLDRLFHATQILPNEAKYYDLMTQKLFTSTMWTRKMVGADRANSQGFTGKNVSIGIIDSVPNYSPCLIKYSDQEIDVVPIEDLWDTIEGPVFTSPSGEEWKDVQGICAYGGRMRKDQNTPWKSIHAIIRHHYKGMLKRIRTFEGIVDTSPNHSIFVKHGTHLRLTSAIDLKEGERLSILKPKGVDRDREETALFIGGLELAWLYGFFVAEGSAYVTKNRSRTRYAVSLCNTNMDLLTKAQTIFKHYFQIGKGSSSCCRGVWKIEWRGKKLYRHFRNAFYTISGFKKVPRNILNAKVSIQRSFLDGYTDGDGTRWNNGQPKSVTTNSWTLASGLLIIVERCLHKTYCIHWRPDKLGIIQIVINQGQEVDAIDTIDLGTTLGKTRLLRDQITDITPLNYEGHLYDLQTEDHVFTTGVGIVRVHNTGGTKFHAQTTRMQMFTALPGLYTDANGHGQHVASIAGGKKARDILLGVDCEGMAPESNLISIKALGFIVGMGRDSDVLKALEISLRTRCDIVNLSMGSDNAAEVATEDPLSAAIAKLTSNGMMIIISAGNAGPKPQTITSPGSLPDTITVGAWDEFNGSVANFSSRGPAYDEIKPDIMAPGVQVHSSLTGILDIQSDKKEQRFGYLSGTSMASPHVTGLLACAKQMFTERGIQLTTTLAKQVFAAYGTTKDNDKGWGLIDWSMFEQYLKT